NAVSSVAQEKILRQTMWGKVQFLFGKEAFTWDFCMFSKSLHKQYFSYIENNLQRDSFVLIGHPKSFTSPKSLTSVISLAQNSKHSYSFMTLKEIYERYSS